MNVLNIEHISKTYGEKKIYDDVSCGIQEGDKIGIVGINGTGKSTLLKILAGTEEADEGQVVRQNGLRAAWLPQNPEFPPGATVLSYVAEGAEGSDWGKESEAKTILNHLGLTEPEARIAELSGGQKKRAALARVLVNPADVLLMDEPTNHLDNEMIAWLEEYLNKFKGTLVLVTHDRYFLDRVTNRILELSRGKLYSYDANYSRFLVLKAEREEQELASERKRQSVLRMELEWAKRGCRARTTKQKARLERLELLKSGKAPAADAQVEMDAARTRMGKKTIELHHIGKTYGERRLIEDFDYIIPKNQRLGIIGPNGCGKSTLLKILAGRIEPDAGSVEVGETIRIGYFAQESEAMDPDQRVIDYIRDVAEYIPTQEGRISASVMLERFLFDPAMQYTPIANLSGGERRRLYLLKILASAPNVLLLDEPSNDLDIPTLTILEDYLNSFAGIVVAVSHDRYFLDNVVDRIFSFEGEGRLRQYEGGYTEYQEKCRTEAGETTGKTPAEKKKGETRERNASGPSRLKFSYKEQREYESIDGEVAELEERLRQIGEEMEKNASSYAKLAELTEEKEKAEKTLEEKMERWVYLNELAERIAAQD